jgi:alpha-beta hydrolase superfamily lysophospholipase
MTAFSLSEITTADKLIHQGIFFNPSKPGKKAILWVHGLSSTFYSHIELLNEFAKQSEVNGFGFAAFNNRGHDAISGARKLDKRKFI